MSGEQYWPRPTRDAAEAARYETASMKAQPFHHGRSPAGGRRIHAYQSTVSTCRSTEQGQKIIENLARVLPGHGLDLTELILAQFMTLPRDATLLPVTGQVTDRLALTLAMMKQSGFNVSVFLIDAGTAYEQAAALLAAHDINLFHIETERHLHEISPQKI